MKKQVKIVMILSLCLQISVFIVNAQENDPTVRRAIFMISRGSCTEALEVLNTSVEKYGEKDLLVYYRGQAHACLSEFEKALADYSKAIDINKKYKEAHFSRGKLLIDLSKKEEGCADLKQAFILGYDKEQDYYIANCPNEATDLIKMDFEKNTYKSDVFTAQFPGTFSEDIKEFEGRKIITLVCERPNDIYGVIGWQQDDTKVLTDNERDDLLIRMAGYVFEAMFPGATITKEKIDFKGNKAFNLSYNVEGVKMYGIIFLSSGYIILLMHTMQNTLPNEKEQEVFFDSFNLK